MKNLIISSILLGASIVGCSVLKNAENKTLEKDPYKGSFHTIGDHKFYFAPLDVIVDVPAAIKICADVEMVMVSFEIPDKWTLVTNWMNKNGYKGLNFWSSGRRYFGIWKWTSVELDVTYFRWAANQPDIVRDGNICLSFMSNYGWGDGHCVNKYRVVCESY